MHKVTVNGKVYAEVREYIQALTWEYRLTTSGIIGIAAEFAKNNDKEFQEFILKKRGEYLPYARKHLPREKKES